jgi:hypothetical protein
MEILRVAKGNGGLLGFAVVDVSTDGRPTMYVHCGRFLFLFFLI